MSEVVPGDFKNNPFHEALQVPLARPWFGDEEVQAVADVVESCYLCQGPKVAEFERLYAKRVGVKHAIAVSSGSTGLLVALQALGVGAGDEVIVPDMTFISSATCAMYLGAVPVLCDINLSHFCIDTDRVESLITNKTRAIIPVHYAGQTADMDPLLALADKYDLKILEDSCQAQFAHYKGEKLAGTIGDAGMFSFTPTKLMTTGEGGMITTNSDEINEQCRLIRNFGDSQKFSWERLGFNFRMTEMSAALGICQLGRLDHILESRQEKGRRYNEGLADEPAIIIPIIRQPEDMNYQHYTIRVDLDLLDCDRDQIMTELAGLGVSTRLYFPALHRKEVFAPFGPYDDADFPNSLKYEESAFTLPIYTTMTDKEQDYVISSVMQVVQSHRK